VDAAADPSLPLLPTACFVTSARDTQHGAAGVHGGAEGTRQSVRAARAPATSTPTFLTTAGRTFTGEHKSRVGTIGLVACRVLYVCSMLTQRCWPGAGKSAPHLQSVKEGRKSMLATPVGERPVRSLRQMFAANGVRQPQAKRIPTTPASSAEGAKAMQPMHAVPAMDVHYPCGGASDSSSEERDSIGRHVTGGVSAAWAHNLRGTRSWAEESEKSRDMWVLASSTQRSPYPFLSPPSSLPSSPRANEGTRMRRDGGSPEHQPRASPLSSDVESMSQKADAPPSGLQSASSILGRHGGPITQANNLSMRSRTSQSRNNGVPHSPSHFEYAVATLSQKEAEVLENWCDIVERKVAQTRLSSFCAFFAALATQMQAQRD